MASKDPQKVIIDGRDISLSNRDKVFFPEAGITKGEVVEYYRRVAEVMLPHMKDRPLTMQRFPDGIASGGWYHKDAPDYFPDWIETVEVPKEGGTVRHVVCNDAATLVYLANQGCLTPHIWLGRKDDLKRPDRLIFDLDPSGDDPALTRFATRAVGQRLRQDELDPFLMTTGSRGFHVVVPLRREHHFEHVRSYARGVAEELAGKHPDKLTVASRKAKRGQRVFIDFYRNAYAQTSVAPYSLRARPGAPVATPVDWDELPGLDPKFYNLKNLFRRLAQKSDPWAEIDSRACRLPKLP
ncbi:MAG TPA: non-homologous end-joining DNA ligase [Acidobacteriota bacterium]|nr:non-homologous end-joining DNA ligase [Acidobacteriota bacterium]